MNPILAFFSCIAQVLTFVKDAICTCLVDILILGFSAVIMFDDIDVIRSLRGIERKDITNKVQKRNEVCEAVLSTKGHTDPKIKFRELCTLLCASVIVFLQNYVFHTEVISRILSAVALAITIFVKHKLNQYYDRLKRSCK